MLLVVFKAPYPRLDISRREHSPIKLIAVIAETVRHPNAEMAQFFLRFDVKAIVEFEVHDAITPIPIGSGTASMPRDGHSGRSTEWATRSGTTIDVAKDAIASMSTTFNDEWKNWAPL